MQPKSYTKDERCLLALYDLVIESEDPEEALVDPSLIGQKTAISPKAVTAIVAQLIRGNFAKKIDNSLISITRTGIKVAENLRS
jgi:Mn-dependent DtxR family transcriptional regulator